MFARIIFPFSLQVSLCFLADSFLGKEGVTNVVMVCNFLLYDCRFLWI